MLELITNILKFSVFLILILVVGLPLLIVVLKRILGVLDLILGKEQKELDSEADYYKAIYDESMLWQNSRR